jgi:hypothetical protein
MGSETRYLVVGDNNEYLDSLVVVSLVLLEAHVEA